MFGIVVSGVDGTLNYGVAWRGIDADPARPDAWSAFSSGDSWSGVTADEARNTGILTASFGTKGFLQPGLKWSGTSATATIHLVIVALYSDGYPMHSPLLSNFDPAYLRDLSHSLDIGTINVFGAIDVVEPVGNESSGSGLRKVWFHCPQATTTRFVSEPAAPPHRSASPSSRPRAPAQGCGFPRRPRSRSAGPLR